MKTYAILAFVFLIGYVSTYPTGESVKLSDGPLIAVSDKPVEDAKETESEEKEKKTKDDEIRPLQLRSMNVESNVTNRYAHTVISSRYANPSSVPQEATFSVILPDTAFITGFIMEIKGKQYKAYVEEKKEAKRVYEAAVASGIGAAHVEADARDSNRFTVSMNVEPHSKVIFNLTYEQLLTRKHNNYDMVVNLHPGQLVKDLTVDVYINETKPLTLNVPALRSGNEIVEDEKKNEYAKIEFLEEDKTRAHVHFAPTIEQQKEMAEILEKEDKDKAKNGISGQFVIEYDVERDPTGGQVLVSEDGYFVHFFAPSDLKPIPKHVVFVLDISGSMYGRKLEQVKQAMQVILGELTESDFFNLVEFSFGAKVWNLENVTDSPRFESESRYNWWRPDDQKPTPNAKLPPAFPVTPKYVETAKKIISDMDSNGGTNIYDALSTAVNITNAGVSGVKHPPRPIIIFLTDGDATDGETDPKKIIEMVDRGNSERKAGLFTLAFGSDANKDFLKKISLKNNGFMRHIYEAADASLQLQDFYKSISSPLLADVKFNYPNIAEDTLTKNDFHTLFGGSELVVSGRIVKRVENDKKDFKVHGITWDGPIDFPPEIIKWQPRPSAIGELERLWAYMQIKELLDKAASKDEKEPAEKKRALELALKYSFVTSVTSLVVVKPNETKSVDTEEAHSSDKRFGYGQYSSGYQFAAPLVFAAPPPRPASTSYAHDTLLTGGGYGGGFAGLPGPAFAAPSASLSSSYASAVPRSSARKRISSHLTASLLGRRARPKQAGGYPGYSMSSIVSHSRVGAHHMPQYYRPMPVANHADMVIDFDEEETAKSFDVDEVDSDVSYSDRIFGGPSLAHGIVDIRLEEPAGLPPAALPLPTVHYTTTYATPPRPTTEITEPPKTETVKEYLKHLPWLSAFIKDDLITVDGKEYHLDSDKTITEEKKCEVSGTEGKCKLLSECSEVYSKLTDFEVYKKDYFCTLESDKYAGVCCVR